MWRVVFLRDLWCDLCVFARQSGRICWLFALSVLCVCGGAVCSRVTSFRFCLFGVSGGDFLRVWLDWLWPALLYLCAVVGGAFFLLGPVLLFAIHGAACFFFGASGYAAIERFGWKGLAAHAVLSLLAALVLLLFSLFEERSMTLAAMMRGKLFGAQRGLLYPVETRRFLLLSLAMAGVTLAVTAAAAASQWLIL